MASTSVVAVDRPNGLGWRHVTVDGKDAGNVRSIKELGRLIDRAGLESGYDIHWIGGDCTVWPDNPWYRYTVGGLMALGLLATASMLSVIGVRDIFGALTYSGRITGIIFLLAAALEIVAALAAVDYWHKRKVAHSGMIALIGALGSIAVGSFMLLMQLIDRGTYTWYVPLWVFFTLLSVWALITLVHDRVWKAVPHPKRIVVGVAISSLLAIPNVTYTQIYLPYATSPVVNSAATFGKPSLNEGETKMYLPVHLSVKNAGQIPLYILGSIYWVHGWIPAKKKPHFELIHYGEFIMPPGRTLNPGEEFSEDEIAEIAVNNSDESKEYEKVKVEAELYAIRKDRMTIVGDYERSGKNLRQLIEEGKDKDPRGPDQADQPNQKDQHYFRYQTDISNSNEILNAIRGRQRITLWYVHKKDWPYIYVVVEPPGLKVDFDLLDPNRNKKAIDRYGLQQVRGSMQQKPLAELMDMAKHEPSADESPTPTKR
ncbi:hypothetical protein J7F03_37390 [Streptomyces sp. ISL-43]|uniref:hypothetical protein n=1 Tax=Streptomyces sp. ISL-43 TaxID=2819183 RepID=UPI001BEBD8CF|nr:hypothetical protein [Streptomyces sp. ISL-43]MBT2452620.1 hypothetical protein [Streptomyces sp. ISL-43]